MKKKYSRAGIKVKPLAKENVQKAAPKAVETAAVAAAPAVEKIDVSGRNIFVVFQGTAFDAESKGGYIWAPLANKEGKKFHYWDRMLDVKAGDIILHGSNGCIQAVSTARGECYDHEDGRRIDCDYVMIDNAVKTSDYVEDILNICTMKHAPFNKRGCANSGYLYEMPRELAKIFLKNANLQGVDYAAALLAE